ncbi:unnamed protein product [Strongylus vulgaris]|uniref:Uncharacterized protein n=1 Tax=Strongylus vulgaris TaxID=40348 RepID=A0A3P7KZM8_STRVU|nr:unnamed protein product [Strongylus vulgaris]
MKIICDTSLTKGQKMERIKTVLADEKEENTEEMEEIEKVVDLFEFLASQVKEGSPQRQAYGCEQWARVTVLQRAETGKKASSSKAAIRKLRSTPISYHQVGTLTGRHRELEILLRRR